MTSAPTIWPSCAPNSFEGWKAFATAEADLRKAIDDLKDADIGNGLGFVCFGRFHQWPPPGDWTTWLMLGGRGAGKTRAGAEWVRGIALGLAGYASSPVKSIALVGETIADVRDVMVEGPAGIIPIHGHYPRPRWIGSKRRLEWENGAVALAFSSEDPESLRGPQFEAAWCDELAKWKHAEATWDMLQFGLRLGARPRQLVTTTPRPISLIKRLLADENTVISRARTKDNEKNLAAAFLQSVVARYQGTRLGRQELDAELIEERVDALWHRDVIEKSRVTSAPEMRRIMVAIDPPASSSARADRCGLVAAGVADDGHAYVLIDATAERLSPARWARRAVDLYHNLEADRIVAEVNQGGEMVEAVIRQQDASVPIETVRATRGKYLRAEPIASLYEEGKVHHVGAFPALEDEMCDYALGGLSSGRSPDRLDAMVWALTSLMKGPEAEPRVRGVGQ